MQPSISPFGLTPIERFEVVRGDLTAFVNFDVEFLADFHAIYGIDAKQLFQTCAGRLTYPMVEKDRTGEVEFVFVVECNEANNSFSITLKEKK